MGRSYSGADNLTVAAQLHHLRRAGAVCIGQLDPTFRRTSVNGTYDIFRGAPDGGPIWIEAVQGLKKAKDRIAELCTRDPDEYFVFDPITAKVVNAFAPQNDLHHS